MCEKIYRAGKILTGEKNKATENKIRTRVIIVNWKHMGCTRVDFTFQSQGQKAVWFLTDSELSFQ